jgi:hypothetical protein
VKFKVWHHGWFIPWGVRWHLWRNNHSVEVSRVSVPLYDPSFGILWKCQCGRNWAY